MSSGSHQLQASSWTVLMIMNGSYAAQLLQQFELVGKPSVEQAVAKMHHLLFLTMLISVLAEDCSCIEVHFTASVLEKLWKSTNAYENNALLVKSQMMLKKYKLGGKGL